MSDTVHCEPTQLGREVPLPKSPAEARLETIPNRGQEIDYVVRLTSPEFTTLCPITGQPDFAVIIVDYVPRQRLVESKSFKLFLGSFRNQGMFHEDCTVTIHNRLKEAMDPKYLRVVGLWNPRGGIPIDVVVQTGELPPRCDPLPLGGCSYRGGRQ
ncbi:MAG TPA: preQ(1) synthase [Syntrophobacteraceae bacterium]|nr:preQ(1) synthase [Syntrophobacteraceae bacterium]